MARGRELPPLLLLLLLLLGLAARAPAPAAGARLGAMAAAALRADAAAQGDLGRRNRRKQDRDVVAEDCGQAAFNACAMCPGVCGQPAGDFICIQMCQPKCDCGEGNYFNPDTKTCHPTPACDTEIAPPDDHLDAKSTGVDCGEATLNKCAMCPGICGQPAGDFMCLQTCEEKCDCGEGNYFNPDTKTCHPTSTCDTSITPPDEHWDAQSTDDTECGEASMNDCASCPGICGQPNDGIMCLQTCERKCDCGEGKYFNPDTKTCHPTAACNTPVVLPGDAMVETKSLSQTILDIAKKRRRRRRANDDSDQPGSESSLSLDCGEAEYNECAACPNRCGEPKAESCALMCQPACDCGPDKYFNEETRTCHALQHCQDESCPGDLVWVPCKAHCTVNCGETKDKFCNMYRDCSHSGCACPEGLFRSGERCLTAKECSKTY